jgi:HSP20 family protein
MNEEEHSVARNPMTPLGPSGGIFPGHPFLSLHREMNCLFDDVFRGVGQPAATGSQSQGDVGTFVNASINASETDKVGGRANVLISFDHHVGATDQ